MSVYELDFTSDHCGQHGQPSGGGANAPGEMSPPYNIKINGNSDLSNCIQWNDSGRVFHIHIHQIKLKSFLIHVDAQGPSGWDSGSGYLRFIDYSGDHYDLSVFLSHRRTHYLEYMSMRPGIKTILWSNESFDIAPK